MTKLNHSPDRHRFLGKSGSYAALAADGQSVSDVWEKLRVDSRDRELDPSWTVHNLEHDLRADAELCERAKHDDVFAQNLYAALCNNAWRRDDDTERKLTGEFWSCSWRHAGGIVADMREQGDYINWYCSGMRPVDGDDDDGSVPEGVVAETVRLALARLGWSQVQDPR